MFDPYRASLVVPDHLLTGHMRDCLSLAFRLLPNALYRKEVHRVVPHFLKGIGIIANRLFDEENKSLYSLSMSALYSTALIAEIAFRRGCTIPAKNTINNTAPSETCMKAISLLGSCARLITALWRLPGQNEDFTCNSNALSATQGKIYVSDVQKETDRHMERVRNIYEMKDTDTIALEDQNCPRRQRLVLIKQNMECSLAVKWLDKPNLHRLYELAYCTLPTVGHISVVGELVLEKAHQGLKRALLQSNYKNVQIFGMQSVAMDDWQGRLSSVISAALRGKKRSLFACFRLLNGREEAIALNGELSEAQANQVYRALGPELCLLDALQRQGRTVISSKYQRKASLTWELQDVKPQNPSSKKEVLLLLNSAFYTRFHSCVLEIAEEIRSNYEFGIPGP